MPDSVHAKIALADESFTVELGIEPERGSPSRKAS
jgi:hypothetical protein